MAEDAPGPSDATADRGPLDAGGVREAAGPGGDRRETFRLGTGRSSAAGFSGAGAQALPDGASVTDISEGGLHLLFEGVGEGQFPLKVGDRLGFTLRIENSDNAFDLLGTVRWVTPRGEDGAVGVGVRFCGPDAGVADALRRSLIEVAFGDSRELAESGRSRGKRGRAPLVTARRASRRRKLFLGQILVKQGVLEEGRLQDFIEHEYSGNGLLGRELAEQGLVNDEGIARALAEQQRLSYLNLREQPPDMELAGSLPRGVFERHGCVPVREERGALLVAMGSPPSLPIVEDLQATLGRRVRVAMAGESQVARWGRVIYLLRYHGLVERGLVDGEQLESAREMARRDGASIEAVLTSAFRVPKRELLNVLGRHFDCATYEFDPYAAPPQELRGRVSDRYEQLKAACFAPVRSEDGAVTVAMSDPRDLLARARVESIFAGRRVEFRVAVPDDVAAAVDALFGVDTGSREAAVGKLLQELSAGEAHGAWRQEDNEDDPNVHEDDSVIVRLINRIIEDAYAKGASDIHIEPTPHSSAVVRYRIDGVLHRAMTFPGQYRSAVLSRIKVMSDLDIAEQRRAQSGKIRFKRWGQLDIELRVETFPSVGGVEDAVLRILSAAKVRALDEIDLAPRNMRGIKRLVAKPYGLMLCVGPTGSGKTTTLHSALSHIKGDRVKILTAEDPVEITQPGLRQVQVNPKAGITFASALRSFLRADPDVIMIGEMRDRETAAIAVEASMTGHLVFSTLHTNSAPETIARLLEMGIDPYCFADALLGVLAQRLVRTLCGACRVPTPIGEEGLAALRSEYGANEIFDALGFLPASKLNRPRDGGCSKCHASGYLGRMAIHELLCVSDCIREMICHRDSAIRIRRTAKDEGMRTLKQDGIEKVLAGRATMEAIRTACSR